MHIPSFIERKRDDAELSAEEIEAFISGFTRGAIPDYQASAWAMTVFFRGMSAAETTALTRAMLHSGRVLRHRPGSPPKVDKHSTGGVGDKVSLVLAPLLACDNVWVPMISGRGLGITGGTLDKLESIPGFSSVLGPDEVEAQLEKLGVAMIGQSDDLCPADRKLYALRDVTGTVPSPPLIVASIMCKKLAESLDRLVLDVKYGTGAFMQSRSDAEALATGLEAVAREMGVHVSHLLTPMDEPLGRTVGNALEVAEAVEALQGRGPADLIDLTLDLAVKVAAVPRETLAKWLDDGTAWRKFVALVEAQGGDSRTLEQMDVIHRAPILRDVPSPQSGRVTKMDAGQIARACVALGAGRATATDRIDVRVGCSGIKKVGEPVESGEQLLRIHARDEASFAAAQALLAGAVEVS